MEVAQTLRGGLAGADDRARALHRLGLAHWRDGNAGAAYEALQAAVTLRPEDAGLWRDLAALAAALHDDQAAQAAAHEAVRCAPDDARSWLLLASLLDGHDDAEAEAAFARALAIEPGLAEAHHGLGALCLKQLRLDEAVAHLSAVALEGAAQAMLGRALYLTGDFAGAVTACDAVRTPDPITRRLRARAAALCQLMKGEGEAAVTAYATAMPGDDLGSFLAEAYACLSAFGHREPALLVARLRASASPDDPGAAYLLQAACGATLGASPIDYIRRHFDQFAHEFDHKLVDVLHYRVPETLVALIGRHHRAFDDILDLGCGTGLAAAPLARFGGRLVGVDLSAGMLAQAALRGHYAELVEAEALAYLADTVDRYELIFAADLLVYLGRIETLMTRTACALRVGGILALSIESLDDPMANDVALLPSGRFAHADSYVERLAASDFTCLASEPTTIRREAGRPIAGRLMVFRKDRGPVHDARHPAAADPYG